MHEHHHYTDMPGHSEFAATIVHQRWTDLHTNYILGNSGTITPPSSWYISLSQTAVSGLARNSSFATSVELVGGGYARQPVARTIAQAGIDWAASTFDNTLATGGTSQAADQVTFTFSGTPSTNGANSFYMTGAVSGADNLYVSGDTAATRNFANGDTEKVTLTIKSG